MPVVEVRLFIQGDWSDSEEVQKVLIFPHYLISNIVQLH